MSRLTADQALEMVFLDGMEDLDSGGELDIEEDPDFPLPHSDSEPEADDLSDRSDSDPSPSVSDEDHTDLDEGKQIYKIILCK